MIAKAPYLLVHEELKDIVVLMNLCIVEEQDGLVVINLFILLKLLDNRIEKLDKIFRLVSALFDLQMEKSKIADSSDDGERSSSLSCLDDTLFVFFYPVVLLDLSIIDAVLIHEDKAEAHML